MSKLPIIITCVVLVCICFACLLALIPVSRSIRFDGIGSDWRFQPEITLKIVTPVFSTPVAATPVISTAVATSRPSAAPSTPVSSPAQTAVPEITTVPSGGSSSEEGRETFLPFQSSTWKELADCLPDSAQVITATVQRVIDGDTIDVIAEGAEQRVRYIGIDSPEMDYPLGPEAQAENARLVEGRMVWMVKDESDTDIYQRWLRYVFAEGVFVNEQMVRSGYAMSKGYEPDTACQQLFDQAEAEAQAAALGLWAATPTPLPASASADLPGGGVAIQNIFFDGLVKRVESDEYAEITNSGSATVDLTGWRLNAGNPGQDFVFPGYSLEAGASCRVYTNQTHTDTGGFSFASQDPLWNNQGDCGYLYDSQSNLVDDYCY